MFFFVVQRGDAAHVGAVDFGRLVCVFCGSLLYDRL